MPNCTSIIIERDEKLQEDVDLIADLEQVHAVVARVEQPAHSG
jgi:hypothetical protein